MLKKLITAGIIAYMGICFLVVVYLMLQFASIVSFHRTGPCREFEFARFVTWEKNRSDGWYNDHGTTIYCQDGKVVDMLKTGTK